jgi:hypothetical protein
VLGRIRRSIWLDFWGLIFHSFLGDSVPGFASIPAFLGLGWGISDRFRTGFWTFISPTSEHDFSDELTVDPYLRNTSGAVPEQSSCTVKMRSTKNLISQRFFVIYLLPDVIP